MKSHLKNKYYQDIIALMPGHVYWKDKKGAFLGCNLQQARDAGFNTPEDLIGKTDYDMPWSIQADYLREIDRKVMDSGRPLTLEEIFALPDGTKKIYLSNKLPLFDDKGEVSGILGISFDITERKHLEESLREAKKLAEAANEAKTEFLENMRHDIRTPLTGIIGFAEIIKQEANSVQIKEYGDNLIAASHTLLDFLNEVLDGIKVLTSEIPLVKKKFNFKEMAAKIINLMKPKAIEKGLQIDFDYDSALPNFLVGDYTRIQRILLELLSNALLFTQKGNISVAITLAKQQAREIIIRMEVKDTGIGIPDDKQQEVFLRFKRLTPSYKGVYRGVGLGLAIVKQFIDDLKGEIYCQSKLDIGTVFTCLLTIQAPLIDDEEGVAQPQEIRQIKSKFQNVEKHKSFNQEANKTQVLIVEDQVIAAKVAKSIISALDCAVDVAPDGATTLKYVKDKKYDLIFMDVGLPDINGLELTKQIRAMEWKRDAHVPIVALTAHIDAEDKQKCIVSGMDAVLSKPLTKSTAENILNAFVPTRSSVSQEISNNKQALLTLTGKVMDYEEGVIKMAGNKVAADEMLALLKNSLEEELLKLLAAKKNSDWQMIRSITHKLRGGCSYTGAQRAREACARFESYLAANKTEWREDLFQQLIAEINQLMIEISNKLL